MEMMYPSEYLYKLWNSISQAVKVTFVSSMIIGFAIHMFFFINYLPNIDTVFIYDYSHGKGPVVGGRWFYFFPLFLKSHYYFSWINGFLALLYLSISASLIVKCLFINSLLHCILISALIVSFPVITFGFIFFHDFFGLLLACLAIYLTIRFRYGFCIGFIFIALSLGVYQAYFPVASGLSVLILIIHIMNDKYPLKEILLKGGKLFFTLLLGMVLYLLMLRLTLVWKGTELIAYFGINQMGRISISELPSLIRQSYTSIIRFFYSDGYAVHGSFLSYAFMAAFIISLLLFFMLVIRKNIIQRSSHFIFLFVLILLYPLSCNLVFIMAPNASKHMLMLGGMILFPVSVIVIMELVQNYFNSEKKRVACFSGPIACWILSFIISLCIYNYAILANKVYAKAHIEYEQAFAYSTELVTRIQNAVGYSIDKPIIFLGTTGATIHEPDIFNELDKFSHLDTTMIPKWMIFPVYLQNFLGFKENIIYKDLRYVLHYNLWEQFKDMPIYPESGSIEIINDDVVVKFTSLFSVELKIQKDIDILKKNMFDISRLEVIDESIILHCGNDDPHLYMNFYPFLDFENGPGYIELTYTNTEPGYLQVYYNYGHGLSEEFSTGLVELRTELDETKILLPIIPWYTNVNDIFGIRLDPPNDTVFTIIGLKFVYDILPAIF